MDTQTWSSALKQIKTTLTRWPALVALPVSLILPRYPEPWGSAFTFFILGTSVGMSSYYLLKIWRGIAAVKKAKAFELQCRLELMALTMQINPLMTLHVQLLQQGKTTEAESIKQELEKVFAAQERVMAKWKSSDIPHTPL